MPLPSVATVGVAVAGGAVHVCLRQPRRTTYTAEPLDSPTPEAQRRALSAACRRLGARRARAAAALPENRVLRRELRLPDPLRRQEREAVLRLQVRRRLPTPASAWRYRLQSQGRRSRQLRAVRQADLEAARTLLRGAGLRPVAALATADALARQGATTAPLPAELPRTAPARLTAALAEAARHPGEDDLFRGRDPAAGGGTTATRTLAGAATATALAAVAAHMHLGAPATGNPPSAPPRTAPAASDEEPPPERASGPAEPATEPALAQAARAADARRREVAAWLDALTAHRPEGVRLETVEIAEALTVTARAADRAAAEAYLGALQEHGLPGARLKALAEESDGTQQLRFSAPLAPSSDAAGEPPTEPVRAQLRHLTAGIEDHGLRLAELRRAGEGAGDVTIAEVRLVGAYPAIRGWLAEQAAAEQHRGLRRLHLQARQEAPLIEAALTLALHASEETQ